MNEAFKDSDPMNADPMNKAFKDSDPMNETP